LALDPRRGASGWCVVIDAAAPPLLPLPLPPPMGIGLDGRSVKKFLFTLLTE